MFRLNNPHALSLWVCVNFFPYLSSAVFHVDCIVKNRGVLLHDLLLPGKFKPFFATLKKGRLHGDKGLNGGWGWFQGQSKCDGTTWCRLNMLEIGKM